MSCPTLERICLELLAWTKEPYWLMAKRRMQLLPEHAANTLMELLLQFHRLQSPSQLDAFKACLTELHVSASAGLPLDAEWLAHICSCRHLRALSFRDIPRLRDKQLGPLTMLAAGLQQLDLTGCSGLTNKCLAVLGQLTSLHSLVLTGTSVKSPLLAQLTALQHLTHLHLGGCDVTDTDVTRYITAFSALQDLDLWGCAAGDAAARHICSSLPRLQRLSMAWSKLAAALPLLPGLSHLDLSHCVLRGRWSEVDLLAAAGMQQLRELVLVQTELDALGCELLEVLIRASAPNLQVLDLTTATLDSPLPLLLALDGATQLSALSLSGTQLVDDYLPALTACTGLQTLNLSLNPGITAAGLPATLPACAAQLKQLDLRGTGVDNTALPMLKHLPVLQQLVLADTDISWECKAGAEQTGVFAAEVAAAPAGQHDLTGDQGLVVQVSSRATSGSVKARGWQQLQLLDVSATQLTDAGCIQLLSELAAAAGDDAEQRQCGSSDGSTLPDRPGLRVLMVGSRQCKLGRKALAGLSQMHTLQQLTLQGWDLIDRDVRHLQHLHQLQQLHVAIIDPWLVSDDALVQLAQHLPQLHSLTRDGRHLLHWQAPPGTSSSSSSSHGSIWPAGPLPDDSQPCVTVPWLRPRVGQQPSHMLQGTKQTASPGSREGSRAEVRSSTGGSSHGSSVTGCVGQPASARHTSGSAHAQGSSRGAVSSGGQSVYQRLSAYDERYRYTIPELLGIREHIADTVGGREAVLPGDADVNGQLPAEIQAGSRW